MLYENFLVKAGDSTSIEDKTKVTKNFENNQKINRSMMVESITKLVNNVSQDVMQNNTAAAAASAGASNTLILSNINCDQVEVSGINQTASANVDVLVKSQQANTSKISSEISTSIDKTIEKVGATDLAGLQAENTKQLNDFMKAMPGFDPNKAQNMASSCPTGGGSLISAGNKCDVKSSYELDASVKQSLDLDESFKINDQDDIANEIKTKIGQANFASCTANASSANAIILQSIQCGVMSAVNSAAKTARAEESGKPKKLTVTDIQQDAMSKLYMTCVFDQKNVSEIATKITNSISKKYNQIYDAVQKKAATKGPEWLGNKMDLLDTFAAAGVEKIMAAAGDLPPKKDTQTSVGKTTETKSDKIVDPNVNNQLPERKGFAVDNTPSKPNNLDDFRNKQTKIALDDAKKIKEDAETQAEKIKQKALTDTEVAKKATANVSQPNAQWMIYGGIILGLIVVFFLFKSFAGSNKSKSKLKKEEEEE
jgi:hypothetical protein